VFNGSYDCAKLLLEQNASIDHADIYGVGMLHRAVRCGSQNVATSLALLELLLEKGAVVDSVDRTGSSPLLDAAFWGLVDCVKFLIAKGGDPKLCDNSGYTVSLAENLQRFQCLLCSSRRSSVLIEIIHVSSVVTQCVGHNIIF
jgi:ankyrin repeat protein